MSCKICGSEDTAHHGDEICGYCEGQLSCAAGPRQTEPPRPDQDWSVMWIHRWANCQTFVQCCSAQSVHDNWENGDWCAPIREEGP